MRIRFSVGLLLLAIAGIFSNGVVRADDKGADKKAEKPAGKIRVLLLGDSTVIGSVCRQTNPKSDHLEDVVRKLLAAEGDLPEAEVVNHGVDGDTIHRMLAERYERDVAKAPPYDYIFTRFGLNDVRGLKDKFKTEYPANYKKLIAQIRSDRPQAEIVLETVIPYLGPELDNTINEQVRAVAAAEKLPVLDEYSPYAAELKNGVNMLNYRRKTLNDIPKKFHALIPPEAIKGSNVFVMDNLLDVHLGNLPGWYSDRHPNLAGYQVIGKQIAGYLAPKIREKAKAGR